MKLPSTDDLQDRLFRLLISLLGNNIEVSIDDLLSIDTNLVMWTSVNPETRKFRFECITQAEFEARIQS